jgi:hypothetical protein
VYDFIAFFNITLNQGIRDLVRPFIKLTPGNSLADILAGMEFDERNFIRVKTGILS